MIIAVWYSQAFYGLKYNFTSEIRNIDMAYLFDCTQYIFSSIASSVKQDAISMREIVDLLTISQLKISTNCVHYFTTTLSHAA